MPHRQTRPSATRRARRAAREGFWKMSSVYYRSSFRRATKRAVEDQIQSSRSVEYHSTSDETIVDGRNEPLETCSTFSFVGWCKLEASNPYKPFPCSLHDVKRATCFRPPRCCSIEREGIVGPKRIRKTIHEHEDISSNISVQSVDSQCLYNSSRGPTHVNNSFVRDPTTITRRPTRAVTS